MTETTEELSTFIADEKGIPTEPNLVKLLQESVQVVTFTKLDGDKRVMTCTKSFDVIPKENQPTTNKPAKEGTVTVWDTNANGWRSFRYDRVLQVNEVLTTQ